MDNILKTTINRAEVVVHPDGREIPGFLTALWKDLAFGSIKEKGFFSAALSGGNTPRDFYLRLADEKEASLWERTHLFLVDERFVPFDSPDSNYRMIFETLLSRVPIPPENVHAVQVGSKDAQAAALQYEVELKSFFGLSAGDFPRFDAIFLGLGADGHTASLFPGSSVLSERERWTASVMTSGSKHDRITLTLPVINDARNAIFLVMGDEKSEVLRKVLEMRDPSMPASHVAAGQRRLVFVLDGKAASGLTLLHHG